MSGDQDKKLQETNDRWLQAQIEKHLSLCYDYQPKEEGWLS